MGQEFPSETILLENRTNFSDMPVAPGNFPLKRPKKLCYFYFLLERVFHQGTLQDLVRNNGPLKEPLVVKFTRQLLSAVDFLHNVKNPIIHKDIKG